MLIKFEAKDGASFVMMQDIATPLLRMMGTSGANEGALSSDELASAIKKLKSALHANANASDTSPEQDDEDEPAVSLSSRALPLLEMLERAQAEESFCMWRPE